MLTGGIDLSVGAVASMSGFVVATLVGQPGPGGRASSSPSSIAASGRPAQRRSASGVFRVHPLIMTLGMGLVVLGLANVWQLVDGPDRRRACRPSIADARLRSARSGSCPTASLVFVPVALLILLGLRRTGYGRLLYAIGDNPIAARLSGARSWQVLVVLYVISALLAAIAGFLISGADEHRERHARRHATCCRRSPRR